jgi:hypothetical protein
MEELANDALWRIEMVQRKIILIQIEDNFYTMLKAYTF